VAEEKKKAETARSLALSPAERSLDDSTSDAHSE